MPPNGPQHDVMFQIDGSPEAVRGLLVSLRQHLHAVGIEDDLCGSIELAVAEALNNIVEHAYAPSGQGPLWLGIQNHPERLTFQLRDQGAPLPGLELPAGQLPEASGPLDDLPEGGFGWFLIRDLTDSLDYQRMSGKNQLTLEFRRTPGPGAQVSFE